MYITFLRYVTSLLFVYNSTFPFIHKGNKLFNDNYISTNQLFKVWADL